MQFLSKLRRKLNISTFNDWKARNKGWVYLYQKAFFYITNAKNELLKPLGFWNESILLLTWLAVAFDFRPSGWRIVGGYLALLLIMLFLGKVFTLFRFIQHGFEIQGDHNPQTMEILERLERIENLLQKRENLESPPHKEPTEKEG